MTVYLDSLFLINGIVDYLLLLVTAKVAGEGFSRWRLLSGAVLGATAAALLFLPGFDWLMHPLCKLGVGVLMVVAAYGGSRRLLRLGTLFFALSCALGGGVLMIGLLTGSGLRFENGILATGMDMKIVLLSAACCYLLLNLLLRRCGNHGVKELEQVVVDIGGKRALLTALLDTGNTLTDPATGRPVLVAEGAKLIGVLPPELLEGLKGPAEVLEQFSGHSLGRRLRLLPYRAVGVDCGFLLAIRADRVCVGKREFGGLLVALSPTAVSDGGGYGALFGGA